MGVVLASSPKKRGRLALQALEEAHDLCFRSSWLVTGKRVVKPGGNWTRLNQEKTFFIIIIITDNNYFIIIIP